MPRGHALAGRRRVKLAEVVDSEFVGLPADSALQQLVTQHVRALGKHLAYRVRVRNFEAVCRMVEYGIGVGIVPQTAAERCAQRCLGRAHTDGLRSLVRRSAAQRPAHARAPDRAPGRSYEEVTGRPCRARAATKASKASLLVLRGT